MYRCVQRALLVFVFMAAIPMAAYAQASIAGAVKDTSGAVLPGVTVEAASPSLIEKTRTVVTDGTGQYKIENVRPGVYTITFTLTGFNTIKREGIELTGSFTATVNVELRVGSVEETITVTGETPIVDVQSTAQERVLNDRVINALPSGRVPTFMAALIPGVTTTTRDVGGMAGDGSSRGAVSLHGVTDTRMLIAGLDNHTMAGSTGATGSYNMAAFAEMAVDTGGNSAEYKEGGLQMNLIPRDGGNAFSGFFSSGFANHSMQGSNVTQNLKDRGLSTPDSLNEILDLNPAFGGPLMRDKVWFYGSARYNRAFTYVNQFFNKNAGDPNAWTYVPDTSKGAAGNQNTIRNGHVRLTWQATPKNKFAFSHDPSWICDCPRTVSATVAPEAALGQYQINYPERQTMGEWTSPVTSRLLIGAAVLRHNNLFSRPTENLFFPNGPAAKALVPVSEQSTGLSYRGTGQVQTSKDDETFWRLSVSYVTGAHAIKAGFTGAIGGLDRTLYTIDGPLTFRFNNGVPNQLTEWAVPARVAFDQKADNGLFIQDRLTMRRVTVTVGARYDYYHIAFPETAVGPVQFAPTRNIVFPASDGVRWKEFSPRSGLAYDVFGDGRMALKVSLNRYLASQSGNGGLFTDLSAPASSLVLSTTRSWTDSNRNFVPDCNLLNPAAQNLSTSGGDVCGQIANSAFGSTQAGTSRDPATQTGWGKDQYNWQFSTGVQRQILPRVSLDASYYRTWFGNFLATDNRAVAASDYDQFSITAPLDPRLPGGGGYTVSGLYDLKPAAFGRASDNYLTFSDTYGKQIQHVNGFDVAINARPRSGLLVQGGVNTQKTISDNCEIVAKVPELLGSTPAGFCHSESPFITQVKFLGTYSIPRIDVQLSGTFQSMPGPEIAATFTATNAIVQPSLGRPLAGGAANTSVNIVAPATLYGERMNQVDLRVAKIVKFGGVRATGMLDLYNLFNANPVLTQSNAFASWQVPQSILNARFVKVGLQLDF